MDGHRFDDLTRRLAGIGTRRALLKAAVAGAGAVLAGSRGDGVAAQTCREVAKKCTAAAPCCPGLNCIAKICVPAPGVPACLTPGQACPAARPCCPGTRCAGGVCCPDVLACGNACCANGTLCQGGVCQSPTGGTGCPAGQTRCGAGGCRDLASDPNNCGSCGQVCASGICGGGVCQVLGNGTACTGAVQCASGSCVDGVCCGSPCTGQCESCNLGGSVGTCVLVTGAPVGGRAACGGTGICAGSCTGASAACAYPPGTTICGAATCNGSVATAASVCDGQGGCIAGGQSECAPFGCASGACLTTCASGAECATGVCRDDDVCCPAGDVCVDANGVPAACCASDPGSTVSCCPHQVACCECFHDRDSFTFCCDANKVCRTGTIGDPTYDGSDDHCCRHDEDCVNGGCCPSMFHCPDDAGNDVCCQTPCCGGKCMPFGFECACGNTRVPEGRTCDAETPCCANEICNMGDQPAGTCCPADRAILRHVENGIEFYDCCPYGWLPREWGVNDIRCEHLPDLGSTFRVPQPRG